LEQGETYDLFEKKPTLENTIGTKVLLYHLLRTKSIAATSPSVLNSGFTGATKRAMTLREPGSEKEYTRA
jgi:hypothetical protein